MLNRKHLTSAAALLLAATSAALAQDRPLTAALKDTTVGKTLADYGITYGGHVEASWTYNFGTPDNQTNVGRVFDFEDQDLTLNQVDLWVSKTADSKKLDVGGTIEWMWGGDARLIHANGVFDHYGVGDGPQEQFDPVQFFLDVNLPVGNGLLLRGGKFVTHLGAETINPTTNLFYSHSFSFGFGIPFTHTGLQAIYALNDKVTVMGGVVRGWEQGFEDNNGDAISYIAQVKYTPSAKTTIYFNGITGPEQAGQDDDYRTVLNVVANYKASDELSLALDVTLGYEPDAGVDGDDAWWLGVAGYASYTFNKYLTGNARLEYFGDYQGARTGSFGTGEDSVDLVGLTLGVAIKPLPDDKWGSGLTIRPEVRVDWASEDVFNDGDDDIQFTFGIDAIYAL
jgi:hypothetical protein